MLRTKFSDCAGKLKLSVEGTSWRSESLAAVGSPVEVTVGMVEAEGDREMFDVQS